VNGTTKLLPMTRGDVDILRVALSKLTAGRRHEVVEALLKRLENGTIGGDELAVLRKLVERNAPFVASLSGSTSPGPTRIPQRRLYRR
jgi:hypothetical protein